MNSLILRHATRTMLPLLLLFAVFLFSRGHDHPGGGFAAGLTTGAALGLYMLTHGLNRLDDVLPMPASNVIGLGMAFVSVAGLWSVITGGRLLESVWYSPTLPGVGKLTFGTPYLLELGIALITTGVVLLAAGAMEAEEEA